ncbi:thioredoxin-1-like [Octodon degus]|uniref:Thioredoxin-1-like n=1 Tax=Octodon degus TaxID=10160 RepID=A0A6P6F238_OCTDE|nr:thioredoxin-1-like [Octodon degus]
MVRIIKDTNELIAFLKAAGYKLVVVEFSAKWCGPCKLMGPVFHAMSLKYKNVMFANVDVDESQELAEFCNVQAVPTFQMFKQMQKINLSVMLSGRSQAHKNTYCRILCVKAHKQAKPVYVKNSQQFAFGPKQMLYGSVDPAPRALLGECHTKLSTTKKEQGSEVFQRLPQVELSTMTEEQMNAFLLWYTPNTVKLLTS